MGNMNPGHLSSEPSLTPPSYPDETLAFENFVSGLCIEDTQAALEWHGAENGNLVVECCLALWHGCSDSKEEAKEKRAKALTSAVDDIVEAYAKAVLWPEYKRRAA